jgi:hypothetical protein
MASDASHAMQWQAMADAALEPAGRVSSRSLMAASPRMDSLVSEGSQACSTPHKCLPVVSTLLTVLGRA